MLDVQSGGSLAEAAEFGGGQDIADLAQLDGVKAGAGRAAISARTRRVSRLGSGQKRAQRQLSFARRRDAALGRIATIEAQASIYWENSRNIELGKDAERGRYPFPLNAKQPYPADRPIQCCRLASRAEE